MFDADLDQYDAIAFYNCGLPTEPAIDGGAPVSPRGKKRLLEAIAGGTGFVGIHSACFCYPSTGPSQENQTQVDPYTTMLGGEFVKHGQQQEAAMRIASPDFPGAKGLGKSFRLVDEWYGLKNFARDMHVVLIQETEGMKKASPVDKASYDRPPFPSTWAKMQGKGRVFYTAMGHREDVWDSQVFQQILLGGFAWAMRNVDADIRPNIDQVTPKASQIENVTRRPSLQINLTTRRHVMKRRDMLLSTGAALLGLSALPRGWAAARRREKGEGALFHAERRL